MTTLKTETFSVKAPEVFEQTRVIWESIRLETYSVDFQVQNPEMTLGLGEQSFFERFEGSTFLQKFSSRIFDLYSDCEISEEGTLELSGLENFYQVSRISWDWDDKLVTSVQLRAVIVISPEHHYQMTAYCEAALWDRFRPIFFEVWQSLKYWGDPAEALEKQAQAMEAVTSQHCAPESPPKSEPKPFCVPGDNRDFFRVENTEFEFRPETASEVRDFDNTLSITLKAEVPEALRGREDLIDEYDIEKGVGFRLRFSGVHKLGVPSGQFDFEFGDSENHSTYLWDDGWEYGLEFSGRVELKDGWLGMSGYLGKSYDESLHFEIDIAHKLPVESLEWGLYRFSSVEETEGRPNDSVRYLSIENPGFEVLPEEVFSFCQLRDFSIVNSDCRWSDGTKLPLRELPDRFDSLPRLQSIHINGVSLKSLPPSVGQLPELESLAVNRCELTAIPDAIWLLPKLKYLSLSHNQLEHIPEDIDLPELNNLNLGGNLIKNLPAALAQQPKLAKLELSDNPLQSLPQEFNQIAEIEMSIQDKLRLLNFDYPGIGEWDDELFKACQDSELSARLASSPFSDALKLVAKHVLVIEHAEPEDYSQLGNTRFGGWPDLPPEIPYPRFGENENEGKTDYLYEFLAQLDCEALAPLQDFLPRRGMLYFFLDTVHEMGPKVIYWEGSKECLTSGQGLDFEEDDFFEHLEPPYAAYRASSQKEVSLPFSYASYVNGYLFEGGAEMLLEPEDRLEEIEQELGIENRQNSHEINGYVFTQHEGPELQAALSLKGRPQDWVVLLKVASIGEFQWWDAGELFFVIHKSDLAKRDFSNVYCSLESS